MTARLHDAFPARALHVLGHALILTAAASGPASAQSRPYIEIDMSVFAAHNPFLRPGNDADIPGGQVILTAGGEWPLDHRTKIASEGNLAYRRYVREYGDFLTGNIEAALIHRRSEYLSLRTEASFERILPIEAVAASLDGAVDPISLQDRYDISQALTLHPDARTTLDGRLGWNRIIPRNSILLATTTAVSFDFSATTRVDAITTIGIAGQLASSRSDTSGDPRSWALRAKAARRFPKRWSAELEMGVTQISRRGLDMAGLDMGRERGPVQFSGTANLCHEPGRVRFCTSAAVASVVSSFSGIQREISATTSLDWRTSERGRLVAGGEYRRSPQGAGAGSGGGGGQGALEALTFTSRYEHRLDGRFTVYGGLEYQQRTGLADQKMNSLTFRAGLLLRMPRP